MGKLSRTKGHSYERHVAKLFRHLFPGARRVLEYHEDDCNGIDIDLGVLKLQCKRLKAYAPISKLFEVQCSENDIPVLVTKKDRGEDIVALKLKDFIRILEDIGVVYEDRDKDRRVNQ